MLGVVFNNKEEFQTFYANYAREKRFDVTTRSSNMGEGGKLKYLTLTCARSGKRPNIAKQFPTATTNNKN